MANSIAYAQIFQELLDEQMLQEMTTAWMEPNAASLRYNGGKEVKIPSMTMDGLADYNRSTGYADGDVDTTYQTKTFTMDRGRNFRLDSMDFDESNFSAEAMRIMAEFQRTHVIPEVDSYRYKTIFQLANQALKTGSYTPDKATIYGELLSDISAVRDTIGGENQLVIAIREPVAAILDQSTEFDRSLPVTEFQNGATSSMVQSIDGIPIIRVSTARFKTDYTFTDGFAPTAVAMNMNWIIIARTAPIAVVKTDKPRIFDPSVNQDFDGWKIQYRKYHDLWIKNNALDAVFVSYTAIAAPALTATIAQGSASGTTKATITAGTGNTLAYIKQAGAFTVYYNDIPTGTTAYVSGADIAVTAGQHLGLFELDATGHVVKFVDHTVVSGDIKA